MDPLRAYREAAKLTRPVVCQRAACSLASLTSLEAGARPQKSAVLRRVVGVLAAELDLPYGKLLGEIEHPRNANGAEVEPVRVER
jgi:transcriptional regulator with XRE-family HTH domain